MKKRILSILAVSALLVCLLCGCGKTDLTTAKVLPDEAMQIVLDELGITAEQALSVMVHYGEYEGEFCYSISFSTWERDYEFVVSGETGEILLRSDEMEPTIATGGQDDAY